MSLGLLATPTVTICKVAKMVFNVAPGNFYLSQYLEYQEANGTSATVEALAGLAGGTDAAFVTTVLTNLGLADDAGAQAFLESAIAASGRGAALEAAITALDGVAADDATYGAAATAFNTAVTTSVVYSTNAANNSTNASVLAAAIDPTSEGSAAAAATGINLTISADLINGGATDDVIGGSVGTNPTTGNLADTIQSVDIINGGDGTDTLNFQLGSAAAAVGPTISGVENINGTSFVAQALNMANVTGATSVQNSNSVVAASFTNVANSVDLTVKSINNNTTTLSYSADVNTTLTDTQNLTLDGATNQAVVTITGTGTAETLAITSSGSANKVDIGGTALAGTTTMTIGGDQNFSFDDTNGANAMAALKTITTAEGYTGNVDADLRSGGAVNLAVTLGAGDDKITMTNLTKDDSIAMGEGTDQLTIRIADALTVSTAPTITGAETIVFKLNSDADNGAEDSSINMLGVDATTLKFGATTASTKTNEAQATLTSVGSSVTTLAFNGDGAAADTDLDDVVLNLATVTGTQSLAVEYTNTDGDGNLINTTKGVQLNNAVTANGVENITITTTQLHADTNATTQDGGVNIALTADKMSSLTIVSETLVDLDGGALDNSLNTINATAANGGILVDLSAVADAETTTATSQSFTFTSGSGKDVVTNFVGQMQTSTFTLGAGNDTFDMAASDFHTGHTTPTITVNAGDGNDTIDVSDSTTLKSEGTISISTGAGADTVKISGVAANQTGVTITDFTVGAGGDKIDLATNAAQMATTDPVSGYSETTTIADTMGLVVTGTAVAAGGSATAAQVGSALTVGTFDGGGGTADAIYVAYDDGINTYFGLLTSDGSNDGFTGDAFVHMLTLTGVADATTLSVDNFTDFLG